MTEVKVEGQKITIKRNGTETCISLQDYDVLTRVIEERRREQEVRNRLKEMVMRGACDKSLLEDENLFEDILDSYTTALFQTPDQIAAMHAHALEAAIEEHRKEIEKYEGE